MKKSALRDALAQYKSLAAQIEQLEKERAAVADRIKKAMGEVEEMQMDDTTIRYKPVTSSRFDAQAFRQAHSRLYAAFCKPQTVRRFSVA